MSIPDVSTYGVRIKAIDHSQKIFHMWWAKGPPLSTAQNRSTIMAKLYPLYTAVLGQIGGEGSEVGE